MFAVTMSIKKNKSYSTNKGNHVGMTGLCTLQISPFLWTANQS